MATELLCGNVRNLSPMRIKDMKVLPGDKLCAALRSFISTNRITWVLLRLRVLKAVSLVLSRCTERREGNLLLKKQIQVCRPRAAAAGPEQEAAA